MGSSLLCISSVFKKLLAPYWADFFFPKRRWRRLRRPARRRNGKVYYSVARQQYVGPSFSCRSPNGLFPRESFSPFATTTIVSGASRVEEQKRRERRTIKREMNNKVADGRHCYGGRVLWSLSAAKKNVRQSVLADGYGTRKKDCPREKKIRGTHCHISSASRTAQRRWTTPSIDFKSNNKLRWFTARSRHGRRKRNR